jgi:hypothetical protein
MFATTLQAGSTNLLPGIMYYDGPEKLTGKLVFLFEHNRPTGEFDIPTNTLKAASIYEFDLSDGKMNLEPSTAIMWALKATTRRLKVLL